MREGELVGYVEQAENAKGYAGDVDCDGYGGKAEICECVEWSDEDLPGNV